MKESPEELLMDIRDLLVQLTEICERSYQYNVELNNKRHMEHIEEVERHLENAKRNMPR